MADPTGETNNKALRLNFDRRLILQFRGSTITSDAGLLAYRELDDTLHLTDTAADKLADARTGKNGRHRLVGLLRQSVFGWLAGYEDVNDAEKLCRDPAMRWVVGGRAIAGSAASASQMGRFETKWLSRPKNLIALADLPGQWIDKVRRRRGLKIIILDMDSSESPTYGEQEGSAYRSHGRQDSGRRSARVRLLNPPTLETTMQVVADRAAEPIAIQTDLRAIFVSLELSRSTWLITSLSPGGGEKMSKHSVPAGDIAGLLKRFAQLKEKARARTGRDFPIIVIQEAGLDGFWIHRVLQSEGIESHVVDPASILTSRRRRRAKTDRIDGETLVRTLMAFKRGEPRVCSMARAPTPQEEDRRRVCRERRTLVGERVRHVNRIKGLLFAQGVFGYEPLRKGRRERLEDLRTGDGRPLPVHLKAQIIRELDRLEVVLEQLKTVEAERDALLKPATGEAASPAAMLAQLKGIGPETAAVLWSEGLFRPFDNRRQVAAYAGLAPTPWQSGSIDHEQGVSKAGNPRLRTTMVELAWLWLKNQPTSALSLWFHERVRRLGGRMRKTTIVALARKLLIALWRYTTAGVVIEGAVMKAAPATI